MRRGWRAGLWMLLALGAAAPAAAQRGVPALRMGDSVRVTLSAADPALTGWGSYRAFRFEARPDHVYQFSARTDSGRVGLRIARAAGVLTDYVASSGGRSGVNRAGLPIGEEGPTSGSAALRFRTEAAGTHLLVLASPDTAALTLRVEEISPRAPGPQPIALGSRVQGELGARSGLMFGADGDELGYDLYSFSATRGQRVEAVVSDGQVEIGRMQDGRFVPLPLGDSIVFARTLIAPEDGEYILRIAAPVYSDEYGPYTLWVADPRARPAPRRLQVGRAEEARLDPATAIPLGGSLLNEWVVHGEQGQRLQVMAKSGAFDTYLILGRLRDGGWQEIGRNDDDEIAVGTNSRIAWNVEESGDFLIRVRPYFSVPDSAAPYTLLVEPERARLPVEASVVVRRARPETRPVRWGTPLTGTLDDTDAAAEDGSAYDAWTFTATAGERITITLRSDAFDAYLAVGREEDGEWMELTSNDDFEDGQHHARVVMVAPDTGEFTIRANTFPGQPAGAYTLTVERRR